jgi:hypothetical protein
MLKEWAMGLEDLNKNDFYVCGDRIGGVRRFTTTEEFVNWWRNFDMNKMDE